MEIVNLHAASAPSSITEMSSDDRPESLDTIVKRMLIDANQTANYETASIKASISADLTDPGKVAALQGALADYNNWISLTSTLARKAVTAVESVIKGS